MTFKPGDKAKVIGNMDGAIKYHMFPIGKEVTIISHNEENQDYDCEDASGYKQCVRECDLEPIPVSKVDTVGEEDRRVIKIDTPKKKLLRAKLHESYRRITELESTISQLRAELEQLKKVTNKTT